MLDKIRDFIREKGNIKKLMVGIIIVVSAVVIIANISIEPANQASEVSVSASSVKSDGSDSSKDKGQNSNSEDELGQDSNKADESKAGESEDKTDKSKDKQDKSKNQDVQLQTDNQGNKAAETGTGSGSSQSTENSGGTGSQRNTQANTTRAEPKPKVEEKGPVSINCTITIDCSSISGTGALTAAGNPQLESYAANPTILSVNMNVSDTSGDGKVGVDEALKQACDAYGIQYEFKSSSYVSGINYLYEFNAGPNSGWMYNVNTIHPNRGCNSYYLKGSENVLWYYVITY